MPNAFDWSRISAKVTLRPVLPSMKMARVWGQPWGGRVHLEGSNVASVGEGEYKEHTVSVGERPVLAFEYEPPQVNGGRSDGRVL